MDVDSLLSGNVEDAHDRLHPHALSLDFITSLLVSVATTVSELTACPTDARLTNLGLNSFDIVRIANQAEAELGARFGSHDSHMTTLVQKLLDNDIASAAKYIYEEISLQKASEEDSGGKKRSLQLKPGAEQASKRSRRSSGLAGRSHAGHMRVESWRRGQYFINGK